MASKIDGVIDKLESMNAELNRVKRLILKTSLVPLPPKLKAPVIVAAESIDDTISDIYFSGVRTIADVVLPANVAQEVINNPNISMDQQGNIVDSAPGNKTPSKKPQKVTKKMKETRKVQSKAFKNANASGRLLNGSYRKGWDQSRIARMAQKECTKERIRLGLCDDPRKKKKSSKKRK